MFEPIFELVVGRKGIAKTFLTNDNQYKRVVKKIGKKFVESTEVLVQLDSQCIPWNYPISFQSTMDRLCELYISYSKNKSVEMPKYLSRFVSWELSLLITLSIRNSTHTASFRALLSGSASIGRTLQGRNTLS
jgi:hypothetical protein